MSEINRLYLSPSQWKIHVVNANVTVCPWMRSGGKTTGGIGPRINNVRLAMPRSQHIFYSDTFERIHDKLIPNIEMFWNNEMKLVEDVDYVKFKRPPSHWTKPLIPLNKFDHVISFNDGFALCCASAKVAGSANGYNGQSATIDEAKFVHQVKINTELLPSLRGLRKYFGDRPEYRSHWYFTDKFGEQIKWVLAMKKHHKEDVVNAVLKLQLKVERLKIELLDRELSESSIYNRKREIAITEHKLNAVRKNLYYYCDAQPYENLDFVGPKFFRDTKRDLSEYEYNVAILNKDPDRVQNNFYPDLTEKNLYNSDNDVDPNKPLVMAMDYNWRIIPMVVAQPGKHNDIDAAVKIVRSLHVLYPQGIEEAVKLFAEVYKRHPYKVVMYVFDKTAIGKDPGRKSFKDITIDALRANGWNVLEIYIGEPPEHNIKFADFKTMLSNDGENMVLFNQKNNEYLLKAMYQAGAVTSSGKTKKYKNPEKDLNVPAEETTDYTDAFDQLIWAVLKLKLVDYSNENVKPILKAN